MYRAFFVSARNHNISEYVRYWAGNEISLKISKWKYFEFSSRRDGCLFIFSELISNVYCQLICLQLLWFNQGFASLHNFLFAFFPHLEAQLTFGGVTFNVQRRKEKRYCKNIGLSNTKKKVLCIYFIVHWLNIRLTKELLYT